jgi:hypothetical protein
METLKLTIQKLINFFKSLFKTKSKIKIEEPVKTEVKRLTYTKRTDN